MAVTLRDVAAKAGVSPVVCSRVLHNKAIAIRVSEATAERVKQAAIDLGYRVNISARNFRAQKSMMIGIAHGAGFVRPKFNDGSRYFCALMDGMIEGAFAHGYTISLCPLLLNEVPEAAMSDGRFDGLVWYSNVPSKDNRDTLMNCSSPVVAIHSNADYFDNKFPTVLCDNFHAIGCSVRHLAELGHKRIGFAVDTMHGTTETHARYSSYLTHMKMSGLDPDETPIEIDPLNALDDYLKSGPKHTAVVTNNDYVGSEFIRKAALYGVRVPEDLSVVGFDSTTFCDELRPSLTSARQPLFEIGEIAIHQLVKVIDGNFSGPMETVVQGGFDVRASTCPPK
ncbi:MAG TPA: LacI family DNA-binding transcriptional regulator [Fimbriimonadaceae bacterium]|jgi:LacI family transcriptional regulator